MGPETVGDWGRVLSDALSGLYADANGVHDAHESLPGYHPDQIWHDGCRVCEARGYLVSIRHLDLGNFARAWDRATTWQEIGLSNLAHCEVQLFQIINAMRDKGVRL